MNTQSKYDFVIIGSGMSGLACGITLAKNNYSVLILEKNQQVGGALQVFSRDKCIIDTGVHYLGGLDEGENLQKIFKYLGVLDHIDFAPMDVEGFDQIRFSDGFVGKIAMGYDRFRAVLVADFPDQEANIDAFIDKVITTTQLFPLYNLRVSADETGNAHESVHVELAWDVFDAIFTNERIKHVITGNAMIYAGDMKRTPFYVLALILNSYIKGSYRLPGGGGLLVKALVKEFRKHGGEILKRKEVVDVEVDDGVISKLICTDGSSYMATNYISNLHPTQTIKLVGEKNFLPAYRRRFESIKNTVSSFSVFLTLEREKIRYMNFNRFELYTENPFDSIDYLAKKDNDWPNYLMVTTSSHKDKNEFAESISVLCYMDAKEVEQWEDTMNTVPHPSERTIAYQEWKSQKIQQVLSRFYERYPEVEQYVRGIHCSTPLTYRDYLGTPEGELYGMEKNADMIATSSLNTRTKVKNLFLTGQNVVLHGILGCSIGALLTSFNFINREELLGKINEKC